MARPARPLWALADGVWAVSPLAARRHLASDPHRPAGSGGCQGLITWEVSVDSTIARAHQHAAGARKGGAATRRTGRVDIEPAYHGLGRSRGGLSCKLHLAVEGGQRPLSIVVTAGQRGDSPQFGAVLHGIRVPRLGPGRPRTRPDRVLADKAYSCRATGRCCAAAASGPPFWRRTIRPLTSVAGAARAAGHRRWTRRPTSCATRWSAGSTGSSGTGRWPLDTTSSPSLPGHRDHRRHQRMAMTSETRPSANTLAGLNHKLSADVISQGSPRRLR